MIEIFDNQKEEIKTQIVIARNHWEKEHQASIPQLVIDEKDYKEKMRNFYSYIWKFKLPEWQADSTQHFSDEKLVVEVLQEYAREDWIKNGYNVDIFDAELKKEKLKIHPKNFLRLLQAFGIVFGSIIILAIANSFLPYFLFLILAMFLISKLFKFTRS